MPPRYRRLLTPPLSVDPSLQDSASEELATAPEKTRRMSELGENLLRAREADPADRINLRDPIASYGELAWSGGGPGE